MTTQKIPLIKEGISDAPNSSVIAEKLMLMSILVEFNFDFIRFYLNSPHMFPRILSL